MLVHATTHGNEKCKAKFVAAINRSTRYGKWKGKANRPVVIHWRSIDIDEFLMAY